MNMVQTYYQHSDLVEALSLISWIPLAPISPYIHQQHALEWLNIKKLTLLHPGRYLEQLELSYMAMGSTKRTGALEDGLAVSYVKCAFTIQPSNLSPTYQK